MFSVDLIADDLCLSSISRRPTYYNCYDGSCLYSFCRSMSLSLSVSLPLPPRFAPPSFASSWFLSSRCLGHSPFIYSHLYIFAQKNFLEIFRLLHLSCEHSLSLSLRQLAFVFLSVFDSYFQCRLCLDFCRKLIDCKFRIETNSFYSYTLALFKTTINLFLFLETCSCSSFRKLRCPRNLLHINLFVSFVLRALLALMRDNLMAEGGLGLPQDLSITENGTILFNSEGSVSFSD